MRWKFVFCWKKQRVQAPLVPRRADCANCRGYGSSSASWLLSFSRETGTFSSPEAAAFTSARLSELWRCRQLPIGFISADVTTHRLHFFPSPLHSSLCAVVYFCEGKQDLFDKSPGGSETKSLLLLKKQDSQYSLTSERRLSRIPWPSRSLAVRLKWLFFNVFVFVWKLQRQKIEELIRNVAFVPVITSCGGGIVTFELA